MPICTLPEVPEKEMMKEALNALSVRKVPVHRYGGGEGALEDAVQRAGKKPKHDPPPGGPNPSSHPVSSRKRQNEWMLAIIVLLALAVLTSHMSTGHGRAGKSLRSKSVAGTEKADRTRVSRGVAIWGEPVAFLALPATIKRNQAAKIWLLAQEDGAPVTGGRVSVEFMLTHQILAGRGRPATIVDGRTNRQGIFISHFVPPCCGRFLVSARVDKNGHQVGTGYSSITVTE